ncbi:ubiquinol-cytochrome c reductase complex assembly factor 1 family member [Anaeramoeba flamelloides]|uniref:Ubiquinol-cytochrome c reductase complex assembly factor 1 family member n=1 Tax=Anaeramoeba flamelloides TaxID=1746091 RepID=A0ABQ8YTN0_9EUKA|nr:ubiquinol-cytochrome c reductase complex assembly factor 1 family member [Anaeramoeba flamelloides]
MGNSSNSHNIKARHFKKYLKRLEASKLPVCIINVEGKITHITSTFLEEVGWEGKEHLFKNHKPGGVSAKFQKHFNCDTQHAIQLAGKKLLSSEEGIYTCPWEGVTQTGEQNPLWIYSTLITIKGKPYTQAIFKKRKEPENSEIQEPEEIDNAILNARVSDSQSQTSKDQSNFSEVDFDYLTNNNSITKESQEVKTTKEIKEKENKEKENNSKPKSKDTNTHIIHDLEEESVIDDIVDQIKKKARSMDNMDCELMLMKDMNRLVSVFSESKEKLTNQIDQLELKLRSQKSKNRTKIQDTEEYYQRKYSQINKENQELKKTISELYLYIKNNQERGASLIQNLESKSIYGIKKK